MSKKQMRKGCKNCVLVTGFDCVWTEMEHVPTDWSAVEYCAFTMDLFIFGNYNEGEI